MVMLYVAMQFPIVVTVDDGMAKHADWMALLLAHFGSLQGVRLVTIVQCYRNSTVRPEADLMKIRLPHVGAP